MHFAAEVFNAAQVQVKTEKEPPSLVEIKGLSLCGGSEERFRIQGANTAQIQDFKQFGSTSNGHPSPVKSIRHFFPNNDLSQINKILSDTSEFQTRVESSISPLSVQTVDEILQKVNNLSALEKLLLYLKLPTGKELPDPLKQPLNPLGSRVEISQTITWIKTHLKVDKETSLPKQEVYDEYLDYCRDHAVKPLSTADFGKVMKQVYPDVRPRRLGTRGNSRYCYSGMTKRGNLPPPTLPFIPPPMTGSSSEGDDVICSWAGSVLGRNFSSIDHLRQHLVAHSLTKPSQSSVSGDAFISSSKISKVAESPNVHRKSTEIDFKRKVEEDSSSSSKTPPENCKGKKTKRSPGKQRGKSAELGVPRLPRISRGKVPAVVGLAQDSLLQIENGNSLEQEEELAKYFEKQPESQLRMLLEKTPIMTPKRVSFVPISPITSSQSVVCGATRSQSVPPLLLEQFPEFLVMSQAEEDNAQDLSQILGMIEMEVKAKDSDPVVSALPPPRPSLLLDLGLPSDDSFDFTREVTDIGSSIMPPDL